MGERGKVLAYLEHYPEKGGEPHRVVIHRTPFRIGRSQEADHTIYSREVSSLHAEIVQAGDGYILRDLGSTNGTFVNGERTTQRWLRAGDIVHIAEAELRFGVGELTPERMSEPTLASPEDRQQRLIRETNDLQRILGQRALYAVFQPIVRLADQRVVGYETLGRVELGYGVGEILRIAVERGEGVRLSRMMREASLAEARRLAGHPVSLFFNLHPIEMGEPEQLEETFSAIAGALSEGQRGVVEVHEGAVTDLGAMRWIRDALRAAGLGLAYDDFGAGQSRLMELVEVPPDVIKLDMALVRDIHVSAKRQDLVRALIAVMRDMGIQVLAEGIEREEEAATCQALGSELGQGFLFGRPARIPG